MALQRRAVLVKRYGQTAWRNRRVGTGRLTTADCGDRHGDESPSTQRRVSVRWSCLKAVMGATSRRLATDATKAAQPAAGSLASRRSSNAHTDRNPVWPPPKATIHPSQVNY